MNDYINDLFNPTNILNDSSKIGSISDFSNDIVPILEDILREQFAGNKPKQSVRIHGDNRISFACPFCGDSGTDNYKKRGNIILSGKHRNMFKCFNCGMYMSVDKFFKIYKKNLSINSIEYITNNRMTIPSRNYDTSMNALFNIAAMEDVAISRDKLKTVANLIEVVNTEAEQYLKNRNQYSFDRFLYDNVNKELYVLNLTPSGKIFGLQTRPLYKSRNAKYKTYKLSGIYEMILNETIDVSSEMDTLSMLFNILIVDPSKPIIVTEGPMDAFLLKNSIAMCGAGKTIPLSLNFYYLYDDDATGRKKSIEKLNNKSFVFLWDKFKKDIEIPYRNKWDINDVVNYCKENHIKMPNVLNYFSDDELDLLFI